MKNLYPFVLVLLAACASTASKTAPIPSLEALKPLSLPCLGHPMHARRVLAVDATAAERAALEAEDYAFAYEDARGEEEYVACLEKDPGSEDHRRYHPDAVRWRDEARAARDRYAASLPEGRRISSLTRTFEDIDARRAKTRVEVVYGDGTRKVEESEFEKMRP